MLVSGGIAAALAVAGGGDHAECDAALPLAPAEKTRQSAVSAPRPRSEERQDHRAPRA